MRVVSVNVGEPRVVSAGGQGVETAIFKRAVTGPVAVGAGNLAGDRQADLSVHGGRNKAVYAYPFEHYSTWKAETGRDDFEYGQFGENLTTEGLLEESVFLGDRLRIGSAILEVAQPRMPCFKFAIRMNDRTFPKRLMKSGRTGFYLRVFQQGELQAGDAIEIIERGKGAISIQTVWRMATTGEGDPELAKRLAHHDSLGMEWREAMLQIS